MRIERTVEQLIIIIIIIIILLLSGDNQLNRKLGEHFNDCDNMQEAYIVDILPLDKNELAVNEQLEDGGI